jgi:hypothetical protein
MCIGQMKSSDLEKGMQIRCSADDPYRTWNPVVGSSSVRFFLKRRFSILAHRMEYQLRNIMKISFMA